MRILGIFELRLVEASVLSSLWCGRVCRGESVARPAAIVVEFTEDQTVDGRNLQQLQETVIHSVTRLGHLAHRVINRQTLAHAMLFVPLAEIGPVALFRSLELFCKHAASRPRIDTSSRSARWWCAAHALARITTTTTTTTTTTGLWSSSRSHVRRQIVAAFVAVCKWRCLSILV